MRVLICDDDKKEREILKDIIFNYYKHEVKVMCYSSGSGALEGLQSEPTPQIAFLDILMPYMKGTVLARKMRESGYDGYIVFLTASNDFAAESYGVNAFSYLLKPALQTSVEQVLKNIEAAQKKQDRASIRIKSKKGMYNVLVRELSHIEIWQHNLIFHLANGQAVTVYASYRDYQAQIEEHPRLMRCHYSFFVNAQQIAGVSGDDVSMRSGKLIPISKKYAGFKKKYAQWLFGKDE